MIWLAVALAAAAALGLAALSLGRLAPLRIRVRSSAVAGASLHAPCEAALRALGERLNALAAEVREIERHPSAEFASFPKPALNLSKRSRALRLHRRGDSPDQIAAALEVPRQEIDLLIKVHRIVMNVLPGP